MAGRNDWPVMSLEDAAHLIGEKLEEPNRVQSALYDELSSALGRMRMEMHLTRADILGVLEGLRLNYWDSLYDDDDQKDAAKYA